MEFQCQINLWWNFHKMVYLTYKQIKQQQRRLQQQKHIYASISEPKRTTAFDLGQLSLQRIYPLQIS